MLDTERQYVANHCKPPSHVRDRDHVRVLVPERVDLATVATIYPGY